MKKPVIAIGLDAAEPALIEEWLSKGLLKNLGELRQKGAYGRIQNQENYRAETPWTTFLTGVWPEQTGYWGPVKYSSSDYGVESIDAYKFQDYEPFYTLSDRKVAVFDMPQTKLSAQLDGVQVLAWGAHSPQVPSQSSPASLFSELVKKHGEHPSFGARDMARIYDPKDIKTLYERMQEGIRRRSAICCDLLGRDRWDLFLTVFGESHSAGHYFWHTNQKDHPMYALHGEGRENYLLKSFQSIDRAIGEMIAAAPEDAAIVVFSAHGMQSNNMDVPSTFFLPELLYRWNFPGKVGFSGASEALDQGATLTNRGKWYRNIWAQYGGLNPIKRLFSELAPTPLQRAASLLRKHAQGDITSPYDYKNSGGKFDWQPSTWYRPAWSRMKAFALPSFSEGYVRINLKGREPQGIVNPEDYDAVCRELEEKLLALRNANTGLPIVQRVIRTRPHANLANVEEAGLPDADLCIIWNEQAVTDRVVSEEFGQIGPVPFQRSGSHTGNGFVLINAEGVEPNSVLPAGEAVDFAPTFLEMMDVESPEYFAGKTLISLGKRPLAIA